MAPSKQKKRKKFDGLRKLHEKHVAHRPGYARAKLTFPAINGRLEDITGRLRYKGYIQKLKKTNLNPYIDRPVLEACWVRQCKEKANVWNGKGNWKRKSGRRLVELMAAAAQMENSDDFDVDAFWKQEVVETEKGYELNVQSAFDHSTIHLPEAECLYDSDAEDLNLEALQKELCVESLGRLEANRLVPASAITPDEPDSDDESDSDLDSEDDLEELADEIDTESTGDNGLASSSPDSLPTTGNGPDSFFSDKSGSEPTIDRSPDITRYTPDLESCNGSGSEPSSDEYLTAIDQEARVGQVDEHKDDGESKE